jgi:hypothetical protein
VAVDVEDEIGEDGLEEFVVCSCYIRPSLSIDSLTSQRSSSVAENLLIGLEDNISSISPLSS